jgi:hypothetical protein
VDHRLRLAEFPCPATYPALKNPSELTPMPAKGITHTVRLRIIPQCTHRAELVLSIGAPRSCRCKWMTVGEGKRMACRPSHAAITSWR